MAEASDELEIVKQCIEMIEQETLGLANAESDRGSNGLIGLGTGRLAETLGVLCTPHANGDDSGILGYDIGVDGGEDELEKRLSVMRTKLSNPRLHSEQDIASEQPLNGSSDFLQTGSQPVNGDVSSIGLDTSCEVPDLKSKLAMLATGIQLLSDRIQQKSEQLNSNACKDFQVLHEQTTLIAGNGQDPTAPCLDGSAILEKTHEDCQEYQESETRMSSFDPQQRVLMTHVSANSIRSDAIAPQLYKEHLTRLQESHNDLKYRMACMEAENKRLQEEAEVARKEAHSRALQQETLQKGRGNGYISQLRQYPSYSHATASTLPGTSTSPSASSSSPRRAQRQRLASTASSATSGVSGTPPAPRPALQPPWRNTKQSDKKANRDATVSSTTSPLHTGGRARTSLDGADSVPAGRGMPRQTPRRGNQRMDGTESVPAPRGTPRATPASTLSGSGGSLKAPWKVRAPDKEVPDARSDVEQHSLRTPRNLGNGGSQPTLRGRPSRGGTGTPISPRSRSGSPRRAGSPERELPRRWENLAAQAYCEETGRPIADRIIPSDFTYASGKKGEALFWVNARVRWADLRIIDRGRVPQRGEDLVLFVLHGRLLKDGTTTPSASANGPRKWRVGSTRIIRHLPFAEEGGVENKPFIAELGACLLRTVLAAPSFLAMPMPTGIQSLSFGGPEYTTLLPARVASPVRMVSSPPRLASPSPATSPPRPGPSSPPRGMSPPRGTSPPPRGTSPPRAASPRSPREKPPPKATLAKSGSLARTTSPHGPQAHFIDEKRSTSETRRRRDFEEKRPMSARRRDAVQAKVNSNFGARSSLGAYSARWN
eukprot:TRINITY_DN5635_c0_g5_i1.p1 TRINITY_DN5635_c0_g5~~TRINITY_DN5635_c0_g5_i1.p1  ORF type:complete len:853 (+),score=121.60 TRINITY_DN5635_c0_g5_i1:78-2561(+)